jgi:hypothetical protein
VSSVSPTMVGRPAVARARVGLLDADDHGRRAECDEHLAVLAVVGYDEMCRHLRQS